MLSAMVTSLFAQQCQPTECLNLDSTCTKVGGPFVPAIDGINTILARSVEADGLTYYNTEARVSWNPCWIDSLEQYTDDSCDMPCNCNDQPFCPDTYCSIINGIADLSPALISRAAGLWGGFERLTGKYDFPNDRAYYDACQQLICDINATFDCRGLLRPLIQAGIFENVDDNIEVISIPSFVLDEFSDDPDSSELVNYTNPPNSTWERFNKSRVIYSSNVPTDSVEFDCDSWAGAGAIPDIRRIEARMWFYYLATIYIDLGFTSLHMGQLPLYAYCDEVESDLFYTEYVLSKIRAYAESLDQLLLITCEGFNGDIESNDTLLLDYYSNPARVREVLDVENEPHFGDDASLADNDTLNGDNPNCHPYGYDNKIETLINDIFGEGSPCDSNDYPGIIHPCHGIGFGQGLGGVNFNGITVDPLPYTIYLDFGGGLIDPTPPFDDPAPFSYDTSSNTGIGEHIVNTWGFDDKGWFYHLSKECQQRWLVKSYCFMRNFDGNRANLQIPVFEVFAFQDTSYADPTNLEDSCIYFPRREVLVSDTNYINMMNSVLTPTLVDSFSIKFTTHCEDSIDYCDPRYIKKRQYYKLKNLDIDCSSKYSWHIAKLDSGGDPEYWLDIAYGIGSEFSVSEAGTYRIYLRQDNYGLDPADTYQGVNQVYIERYLEPFCCVWDGTGTPLRVFNNSGPDKIQISPNPNKGQFTINFETETNEQFDVLIVDPYGIVRYSDVSFGQDLSLKSISLIGFTPGMYTLTLRSKSGSNFNYKRFMIVE